MWCRRCGCWAQSRIFRLAGPCQPGRLQERLVFQRRLDMLRAGRHPVTRRPLPALAASWSGILVADAAEDVSGGSSSRSQQEAALPAVRCTPVGRPFLDRRRQAGETALDGWLVKFMNLFPEVDKKRQSSADDFALEEG